jgi:uncharacterized protein (DUF58 family)
MPVISKAVYRKIRRIQILSTQLANDVFAGAYHSAFKGRGIEFAEVREYQPGDEVRRIDWNVTARMNHPYIKNFNEERGISVLLFVDVSASTRFGSRNQLKSELIAEIGAILAFSAIKNNDKVGLVLFSDIIEKVIPANRGVRHILRIIRELLIFEPKQRGSDVKGALALLGKFKRASGICFLISDFICEDFSHEAGLISRKHDLISICVNDPYEKQFPPIPLVSLSDLETGQGALLDTTTPFLQKQFSENSEQRVKKVQKLMGKLKAGFIEIRTDQSYMMPLRKFFKLRERGRR